MIPALLDARMCIDIFQKKTIKSYLVAHGGIHSFGRDSTWFTPKDPSTLCDPISDTYPLLEYILMI